MIRAEERVRRLEQELEEMRGVLRLYRKQGDQIGSNSRGLTKLYARINNVNKDILPLIGDTQFDSSLYFKKTDHVNAGPAAVGVPVVTGSTGRIHSSLVDGGLLIESASAPPTETADDGYLAVATDGALYQRRDSLWWLMKWGDPKYWEGGSFGFDNLDFDAGTGMSDLAGDIDMGGLA